MNLTEHIKDKYGIIFIGLILFSYYQKLNILVWLTAVVWVIVVIWQNIDKYRYMWATKEQMAENLSGLGKKHHDSAKPSQDEGDNGNLVRDEPDKAQQNRNHGA